MRFAIYRTLVQKINSLLKPDTKKRYFDELEEIVEKYFKRPK
jgi:hypothetical protein